MTDFLLELRCEEIPARMQAKASDDLARLFAEELGKAGLAPAAIDRFVTPRRLALIVRDLPLETAAVSEEHKGPRTSAPAQALDGFLRKTGLTQEQLEDRDGVWFAVVNKPGRPTADVLAKAIPAVIRAFPWPKSMRWGTASQTTESLRWVRPLQGIVAILGDTLVDVEVEGIRSGVTTLGHRFHHSGDIVLGGAHDYAEKLRAAYVIVDPAERQAIIETKAAEAAAAHGYTVIEDKGLVAENAGLTEWPVPLLGDFDPAFLEVPPEVIQLTLRINQKYFVLRDAEGKLAPAFICTANIDAKDGGAAIIAGNRKVLAARLSDARFFWQQDRKTSLADHAKKLERITFHEKLGTVADKVERVAKLARWLVEEGIVPSETLSHKGEGRVRDGLESGTLSLEGEGRVRVRDANDARDIGAEPPHPNGEREQLAQLAYDAAKLCKADLVTEMVGEFPELQGIMGGYYARAEGLPDAVADAIRDHYKPVGQGDDVPTAPVTVAVSLADKLDTLAAFDLAEEVPSGSRDPFAIRRQALGIINLIVRNGLKLSMKDAIKIVWENVVTQRMVNLAKEPNSGFFGGVNMELMTGKKFVHRRDGDDYVFLLEDQIFGRASGSRATELSMFKSMAKRAFRSGSETYEIDVDQRPIAFIADRLKVQQKEAGVRHDLIDAVFALGGEDDLVRLLARVHALQSFVATDDGANLLAGYKRAANILKKEAPTLAVTPAQAGVSGDGALTPAEPSDTTLSYEPEQAEADLIAALDSAEPRAAQAVEDEAFEAAMAALATLRAPIDAFFDTVTVNDANQDKRAARLALLARVRDAVHKVADFSKIAG